MPELPTGTVTFLFTDIEGSTARWEQHPDEMRVAVARHDKILESAIDATAEAYSPAWVTAWPPRSPRPGAPWRQPWSLRGPGRGDVAGQLGDMCVRIGLHIGEGELVDNQYLS
ncbi:MAG TPA: hypothetical protein VFA11_19325 [Acidimicrobiales bacterium]|nr:hypothetical protein [Acidimicrobiales bacterium]